MMVETKILKILDKFKWFYEKIGVNYKIMRIILEVKLKLNSRTLKVGNVIRKSEKNNLGERNKWFYIYLGIILMFLVPFRLNMLIQFNMYFFLFMLLIIISIFTDYSNDILDIRDKSRIDIRGIDSKTINAARITNVIIYVLKSSLYMCTLSVIASLRYGILFSMAFVLQLFLIEILAIGFVGIVYCIIFILFDGEKIKDIISNAQIAIMVIFITIYPLVCVSIATIIDCKINYNKGLINYLFPHRWFTALLYMIDSGQINKEYICLTLLSIIVPIANMSLYIMLSGKFEKLLIKLSNVTYKEVREGFGKKLSKIICKNKIERIFYEFSYSLIERESQFKLSTYPSIIMGFVMIFILLMPNLFKESTFSASIEQLSKSRQYLTFYQLIIQIPMQIPIIQYTKEYKGAWVYNIVPIADYNIAYKGAIKAFIVKFIAPLITVAAVIYILIFKATFMWHLAIMLATMVILIVINVRVTFLELPFSMQFNEKANCDSIIPIMLSLFLSGIFILIHVGVSFLNNGVKIYTVIILLLAFISWKKGFKSKRNNIKN